MWSNPDMTNDNNAPDTIDQPAVRPTELHLTLNRTGKWLLAVVVLTVAAVGYGAGVSDRPAPVVVHDDRVVETPVGCDQSPDELFRDGNGSCVHIDAILDNAARRGGLSNRIDCDDYDGTGVVCVDGPTGVRID